MSARLTQAFEVVEAVLLLAQYCDREDLLFEEQAVFDRVLGGAWCASEPGLSIVTSNPPIFL
jgi:hypothetical protein